MRFFRKKDKRDKTPEPSSSRMPGFGGDKSSNRKQQHGHCVSRSFGHDASPQYSGSPMLVGGGAAAAAANRGSYQFRPMATAASTVALLNLPPAILERIFAFVCPQAADESYETCEQSSIEDACMLCDLRDLAHCVAVCKSWRVSALKLLYHSIRLDTVHYCEREAYLSDMRKRGSFLNRNADPEDATQARLKLLCRTLREDPVRLGRRVEFLKTPYMLRESSQADLARTIAVLPNLKYVDLPEGMYMDEPNYLTLRMEVQARCREMRKMTYMGGSERSLQALANGTVFTNLEVLELIKINIDPAVLRQVLYVLRNLRAVKVTETTTFNDEMFYWNDMIVPVPPLEELVLNEVPNVTSEGLRQWLESSPDAAQTLKVLSLNHTGVEPSTLHQLLPLTPVLKHLSLTKNVTASLATATGGMQVPLLASHSLKVLHYEITSKNNVSAASTTASYHQYLANSLLSGCLPNLHAVYVRDSNFPDTLLGLPPPMPGFAGEFDRPSSRGSMSSAGMGHMSPPSFLSPMHSPRQPHQQQGQGQQQGFSSPFGSPTNNNRPITGYPSHQRQQSAGQQSFIQNQNPTQRFSSNNPFAAMVSNTQQSIANLPPRLEVFTKANDDLKWSFIQMPISNPSKNRTSGRPLSQYGLGADVLGGNALGWSPGTGGARRSVLVTTSGGGHFLEVPDADGGAGRAGRRSGSNASFASPPHRMGGGHLRVPSLAVDDHQEEEEMDEWPRPLSRNGETKKEKLDLWR